MSTLTASTASAVRDALDRRGLPQRAVAPALCMSQQALSDRLTGRTPFTLDDLARVAEYLGCPVAELLQPRAVSA